MEEIHIPFVLWFAGDEPLDLSGMTDPIVIPISFHTDLRAMQRTADGPVVDRAGGAANV